MRFCAKDHLGESNPLVTALTEAGHEFSHDGPTDLFLIDLDTDLFGYREMIDFYREQGAVVLQYPHGMPTSLLQYDCLYSPYDQVDGQLTAGQGEIDFLRSLNIDRPAKIIGWQICRQFEFRTTDKPRRVVFAPTHVNADGTMDKTRREANASVYRQLLKGNWDLVVRFIGELEENGLWKDERVFRYVQGNVDMSTVEIDAADCVVAAVGTYPCLALARGVPTIMYGQFSAALYGLPGEEAKPLRNLEKYRDILRYPYDALEECHFRLDELIRHVCREEHSKVIKWQQQWIGEPFDGPAFVKMIEEWIPELREVRSVLTSVGA